MELQTEHHLESVGRVEVLPGPTGRRQWPDELKGRIVSESFLPGAQVKEVARRHGVAANHLSTWRRLARDGKLVVPVDEAAVFAELVLEEGPVLGYVRGEDLSPGHRFYRRNVSGVRTHKVRLCLTGHWAISRMLRFRDLLRRDANLRDQYQSLKLELEAENTTGMAEYLAGKAPFIDAIIGPKPVATK